MPARRRVGCALTGKFTELDWTTYERTAYVWAAEFERIGAARIVKPAVRSAPDREAVLHSNHQLGTTRMSMKKEDGVVNPDCRAHDYANLYIMGGSIFPTVSWANPTFTLMALTLRLADHLCNIKSALIHTRRDEYFLLYLDDSVPFLSSIEMSP